MDCVDWLVHARWVVPVEPPNAVLERHSVAVRGGALVAVLPTAEARLRFATADRARTLELGEAHVVLPGLVNMHTHAAMTPLRGLVDNIELMDWLAQHIWPAEARFVDEAFVRAGTRAGVLEFVRHGTTTFNDMYFFPGETARVADEAGVRAAVAATVFRWPNQYAQGEAECVAKGIAALRPYLHHPRVLLTFGPHAPYSVSDDGVRRILAARAEWAEARGVPPAAVRVHMHVHETAHEVNESVSEHGVRPLARLDRLGLLDEGFIAVHSVKLSEDEIRLLRARRCSVVHCPESNMKLGSGIAPVVPLLRAGVNVCLGTDSAASNDDLNLLGELRTAVLLSKIERESGVGVGAMEAIAMATLHGARALGLDDRIGSLLPGKEADFIAVRLDGLPVFNPVNTLAYNGDCKVTHVWVAGRPLMIDSTLLTLDEAAIQRESVELGERIWAWKHHGVPSSHSD